MADRSALALALLAWLGTMLLLANLRIVRSRSLADRLRPYGVSKPTASRNGVLSVESFKDVLGPLAKTLGSRLARVLGIEEDLSDRLRFTRSRFDATGFRLRQLAWSAAGMLGGILVGAALQLNSALYLAAALGGALLGFCLVEQLLANAATKRRQRLFAELPAISEQIAMLLGAGWSLGASLNRVADRGRGVCATDLKDVCAQIRHGASETKALQDWSELANVPALGRLVSVLALHRETADLGSLVSEEAEAIRRESHRELISSLEKREQMVWIPVTVATLVPGVIFLAIPFFSALSPFTN